jgi:simple sugar transport system permease protein
VSTIGFWSTVIAGAFGLSAPIIVAGLGEIYLERAGGFNVGIEGMMLLGASIGVLGSHVAGVWAGVAAGTGTGVLLGAILGVTTAFGEADIIIVGIAISLLGAGLSDFSFESANPAGATNVTVPTEPSLRLSFLARIPLIGQGLAQAGLFFWFSLALVVLTWWVLHYTRFGLRLRAVGDDPDVAATRGIPVKRFRLGAAVLAGGFAGLGGTLVTLTSIGTFSTGITGGAGFIALAVVIIGRRAPFGLLAGALIFSFFNSLALLAQTRNLGLPVELYQALPYLATLAVLCVVSRAALLVPLVPRKTATEEKAMTDDHPAR